jgi:hypothetical protein
MPYGSGVVSNFSKSLFHKGFGLFGDVISGMILEYSKGQRQRMARVILACLVCHCCFLRINGSACMGMEVFVRVHPHCQPEWDVSSYRLERVSTCSERPSVAVKRHA